MAIGFVMPMATKKPAGDGQGEDAERHARHAGTLFAVGLRRHGRARIARAAWSVAVAGGVPPAVMIPGGTAQTDAAATAGLVIFATILLGAWIVVGQLLPRPDLSREGTR